MKVKLHINEEYEMQVRFVVEVFEPDNEGDIPNFRLGPFKTSKKAYKAGHYNIPPDYTFTVVPRFRFSRRRRSE